MQDVQPLLIEMRGRMVHELAGPATLQPYGWKPHEVIYSIGRAPLNRLLIDAVARHENLTLRFRHTCLGMNAREAALRFQDEDSGAVHELPLSHGPVIATDGAGSAVRASLARSGCVTVGEEPLDHDYKELTLPPVAGRPALEVNALHVWPRGGFMLIALPNPDASFTATLFLARSGARSFAALSTPQSIHDFFAREFPDALPLMPNLLAEFREHPQAQLGTVHVAPWHIRGQVLLLGDAAHTIVPFHGQGMNAAFEDCALLDELLDRHNDWERLFAEFDRIRRPNAEAIAAMALENYVEMRDTVLDARFQRHKALAVELERRFPDRFIPRYSMVMFHPEIPYAEALRRGAVQESILNTLDANASASETLDPELARSLIHARLPPISSADLTHPQRV
jgi:kynurenine 3-monooxygenase